MKIESLICGSSNDNLFDVPFPKRKKQGIIHIAHLWFASNSKCLPMVQILTLYPPVIITIYVPCAHLSLTVTLTQKIGKKSLPSRSKHSLFQKPLTHSHPACSPKITQCHSQKSLTHSLPSFMQTEPRKTASPFSCGRKTHSWVSRFPSLEVTGI